MVVVAERNRVRCPSGGDPRRKLREYYPGQAFLEQENKQVMV